MVTVSPVSPTVGLPLRTVLLDFDGSERLTEKMVGWLEPEFVLDGSYCRVVVT